MFSLILIFFSHSRRSKIRSHIIRYSSLNICFHKTNALSNSTIMIELCRTDTRSAHLARVSKHRIRLTMSIQLPSKQQAQYASSRRGRKRCISIVEEGSGKAKVTTEDGKRRRGKSACCGSWTIRKERGIESLSHVVDFVDQSLRGEEDVVWLVFDCYDID